MHPIMHGFMKFPGFRKSDILLTQWACVDLNTHRHVTVVTLRAEPDVFGIEWSQLVSNDGVLVCVARQSLDTEGNEKQI